MAEQLIDKNIIKKKPASIKSVNSELFTECCTNDNYSHLLRVLEAGPLTIDEIREKFPPEEKKIKRKLIIKPDPTRAAMQSATSGLTQVVQEEEVIEFRKKSESTIYRYIKELKKQGFIIEVGRKIHPNQTSSKILYNRSAKIFIAVFPGKKIWNSERGKPVAEVLGGITKHHFQNNFPIAEKIQEIFLKYETKVEENLQELIEEIVLESKTNNKIKKFVEEINHLELKQLFYFYELLGRIDWFLHLGNINSIVKNIQQSFSKEKNEYSFISSETESDSPSSDVKTFQDLIDRNYKPKLIKIINENDWFKFFTDPNYGSIISLLRKTPRTLKEIHEKHRQLVIERMEKKDSGRRFKKPKEKKENTLYRYLKDLQKAGLIVEAGRRVTEGQSFTQILYGRTSDIFYYMGTKEEYYVSEEWKKVTKLVAKALEFKIQKQNYHIETLTKIFTEMELQTTELVMNALSSSTEKQIYDAMFKFDHEQHKVLIQSLGLIEWFLAQKDKEKLKIEILKCYND